MADALKPGGMGDADEEGMPTAFADSMAAAMEKALNEILDDEGKPTFGLQDNSTDTRDRRLLFVAIAQGIVNHLTDHEGAFVLKNASGDVTDWALDIKKE